MSHHCFTVALSYYTLKSASQCSSSNRDERVIWKKPSINLAGAQQPSVAYPSCGSPRQVRFLDNIVQVCEFVDSEDYEDLVCRCSGISGSEGPVLAQAKMELRRFLLRSALYVGMPGIPPGRAFNRADSERWNRLIAEARTGHEFCSEVAHLFGDIVAAEEALLETINMCVQFCDPCKERQATVAEDSSNSDFGSDNSYDDTSGSSSSSSSTGSDASDSDDSSGNISSDDTSSGDDSSSACDTDPILMMVKPSSRPPRKANSADMHGGPGSPSDGTSCSFVFRLEHLDLLGKFATMPPRSHIFVRDSSGNSRCLDCGKRGDTWCSVCEACSLCSFGSNCEPRMTASFS